MMSLRICIALALSLVPSFAFAEVKVVIRTDHPGGNATVLKNEGAEIELAPDLRGNAKPWFYWNIAAEASQPGRVKFTFDAGGRLGARGPAVSLDDGKTWSWLGLKHVVYGKPSTKESPAVRESFEYQFTAEHKKVRLAMAMPYQLHDLEAFLARQKNNKNLTRHVLARTTKGTFVPLVQIGEPGTAKAAMILTSRNHACESMASYVHEGFLEEASSESPLGVEFRKRFALFSVPIVDLDGVEAGEQGKWRAPHDHNRDYGDMNLYPEVKAIQDLAAAQNVRYGFDLHCPAIRGDIHEAFYFDGLSTPTIKSNVDELTAWIREERPQTTGAPLNLMKQPPAVAPTSNMPMSYYFAYRPQAIFGATLEVPYAQTDGELDAAMARAYGRALLRAWVRTSFITAESEPRIGGFAELAALRTELGKTYRGNPKAVEEMLAAKTKDAGSASPYPVEAQYFLSLTRGHQKQYAEARKLCEAAAADPAATTHQQGVLGVQLVRIASLDPEAKPADVEAQVAAFDRLVYPANERRTETYGLAADYYRRHEDQPRALEYARRQLSVAAAYERGRILNQIAASHDLLNQREQAFAVRREAVEFLRPKLEPLPVSVFAAMMAADLFDAVTALPDATPEEIRSAGAKVLEHKISSEATRKKVRAKLAELEKKK